MSRHGAVPSAALLILSLAIPLVAQSHGPVYSEGAEKQFSRGLAGYQREEYQEAREHFQKLLEFPLNQRTSAAQLMFSKSLFHLGQYGSALQAARSLQRRFPASRYLPDARLVAGDCYFTLRRYYEAATQYGRILATPASLALQASASERLAGIVKNRLISAKALESIRLSMGASRLREALIFGEARWYSRLGWEEQSRAAIQTYVDSVPKGIFAPLVERGALGARPPQPVPAPAASEWPPPATEEPAARPDRDERPGLGLLLPLSGPYRSYGRDLLDGARLANLELGEPFALLAEDTGFDYGDLLPIAESPGNELLRTVQAARRLIEEAEVTALIGPVFSSATVVAAVAAEAAGVPMIAPLAQLSGLDSLGENIFQMNVIAEIQGRALAEHATLVLGLHNLVVLAPLTDYGWRFQREFTGVAHANGGDVVHVDWYVPGETKDFKRIFEEVRKVGFGLMPPPPADTLAAVDSLAWLGEDLGWQTDLSEPGRAPPPELVAKEEAPPDSSEIFIDAIHGIAVVVESFDDAQTIAPQLRFHRLDAQILGNDLWYEPAAIRQMLSGERSHVQGAVFVARQHENAPLARRFTDAFRREFGRDPGYAAHGYDAARMVLEAWRQGSRSRTAVREWLAALQGFDGASGGISFAEGGRTNGQVMLLKIAARGRVRPLSAADLPDLGPRGGPGGEDDLPAAELPIEVDSETGPLPTAE